MRYITSGESHGEALIAVIEGLPSNLLIDEEFKDKGDGSFVKDKGDGSFCLCVPFSIF